MDGLVSRIHFFITDWVDRFMESMASGVIKIVKQNTIAFCAKKPQDVHMYADAERFETHSWCMFYACTF